MITRIIEAGTPADPKDLKDSGVRVRETCTPRPDGVFVNGVQAWPPAAAPATMPDHSDRNNGEDQED